ASGTQLGVAAPANGNEVPPGYYMLFLVDSEGVPSVSKMVKIGSAVAPPPPPPPPPPTDTIGLAAQGSLTDSGNSGRLEGSRVLTGNAGTIVSMSVFVSAVDSQTANRAFQLGIYTDAGGRPGTRVANSATGTLTANSWNTLPVSATLQANTAYWLIYSTNGRSSSVNNMYGNIGTSGQGVASRSTVTFGTMPTTFPSSNLTAAVYSLYGRFGP
ncbi:MAG: galactose oxidase-like domain-containing protein, partial [Methylotetracoccus sp.]